jgi:hypothetical protein
MAIKDNSNKEQAYNPFAEMDDEDSDFSALFAEPTKGKSGESEEQAEEGDQKESKAPANVLELLDTLPDAQKGPLKEAFTSLARQIEGISNKSGVSKEDLQSLIQGIQQRSSQSQSTGPSQEEVEEQNSRTEISNLLKELGLEDENKTSRFVKALDVLSERRAKRVTDPYVRFLSERFAKEEKAQIQRDFPIKDGYPSLEDSQQSIVKLLQRHPNMELGEAYEFVNANKIAELKVSKGNKPEGGGGGKKVSVSADDVLRKFSLSSDRPSTTTETSVKKTGQAKTIKEAMSMALEEMGLAK